MVEVLDNPCRLRAVVIDCRGVADVQLHLEVDLVADVHLHLAVVLDDQCTKCWVMAMPFVW